MLMSVMMLSACTVMPEKNIYTSIDIEAPRDKVWRVLAANDDYPQWNPYHVKVEGNMTVGSRLDVVIHKPNGETVEIEPRVLRLDPPHELTWGGGIKGIFYGEHVFLLVPLDNATTRLVHKEKFSGIAIPFASLETIEEGYELMNRALKDTVEKSD